MTGSSLNKRSMFPRERCDTFIWNDEGVFSYRSGYLRKISQCLWNSETTLSSTTIEKVNEEVVV